MFTAQVESARPPANLEKQVFALKPPQLSVLQRYLSIQDSALHSAISRRWMLLSMGMKKHQDFFLVENECKCLHVPAGWWKAGDFCQPQPKLWGEAEYAGPSLQG